MEMPFLQIKPYGCGLYAVAHACNLPKFVTDERLELSRLYGNTMGQLSKWLQDDGYNFALDTLYYNHAEGKLPEKHTEYTPQGEDKRIAFLPILLNTRNSEEGLNHVVAGKIARDGSLFLYDSLKTNVIKTTLAEVNNMYKHVYGLWVFMDALTGSYVFIHDDV